MVATVINAKFLHINSKANGSRHDLLRRGQTIKVGAESNPYFGYYESYTRSYPVTIQADNSMHDVPALEFLRQVKLGTITTNDLATIGYDTARSFMMLAREFVWENIRAKEFPDEPSRQTCIWLLEVESQVADWIRLLQYQPMTYCIVQLRATGRILAVDSSWLARDSEPLPTWYEKARRYWRGEMSSSPTRELLFEGSITVEEILNFSHPT